MKKFLKFLLIVFLWFLVLGISIAVTILINKPMMLGVQAFFIVFFSWYTVKLIIYVYKRWQAKKRVEKLVNVEKSETKQFSIGFSKIFSKTDYDQHLSNVIQFLKENSPANAQYDYQQTKWNLHLKFDNKHSEWINSESLSKPSLNSNVFTEHEYLVWRPLNQTLLVDVDAYLVNANEEVAKHQWFEFLDSLSMCSKIVPVDGITVTIHVDMLDSDENISFLAGKIQSLVEDVRKRCGFIVPVNMVLLGLDELSTIDRYLDEYKQACVTPIGTSIKLGSGLLTASEQFFTMLQRIVQKSTLDNVYHLGYVVTDSEDSHQLNKIYSNVQFLVNRLTSQNEFNQPIQFSGLFLGASPKHAQINHPLLESTAICPYVSTPTYGLTESDKQKNKRLGVYYSAAIVLVGMMNTVHNMGVDQLASTFAKYDNALIDAENNENIIVELQARSLLIRELDEINLLHWYLNEDPLKIEVLARGLSSDINLLLVEPIESEYEQNIQENTSLDAKIDYLNVLVRRVNMANAVLAGDSIEALSAMPVPFDSAYISDTPPVLLDGLNALLIDSFDIGRRFYKDSFEEQIVAERIAKRAQILQILQNTDGKMDWLVEWTNSLSNLNAISLADYWLIDEDASDNQVSQAYTLDGKSVIDDFIDDLNLALGNQNGYLLENKQAFSEQYERNYVASWSAFLSNFNEGKDYLTNREDWLFMINNLPTARNPFFQVMNDAWFQLEPFAESDNIQDWHSLLIYYQDMLALSGDDLQNNDKRNKLLTKMALKLVKKAGPVGKAIAGAGKSGMKTQKKLDKASGPGPGPTERELNLEKAAQELDAYKSTIAEVVFNIERRNNSYASINQIFDNPNGPETGDTSLARAYASLKKLEALIGKAGLSTMAFWEPLMGATKLSRDFMKSETACYLNEQWESEFLYDLEGVPEYKITDFAYGENGYLWQFIDENMDAFLKKRVNIGYQTKRINKQSLPFKNDFIKYINQAMDANKDIQFSSYPLEITAYPTSVNRSALLYVGQTELTLKCADETLGLVNDNFIVSKKIEWTPSCNEVGLRFWVGNYELDYMFTGKHAVRDFLRAFETGSLTIDAEAFPEYFYNLKQFQVRHITVSLNIQGADRLLASLDKVPPSPPRTIAQCWI